MKTTTITALIGALALSACAVDTFEPEPDVTEEWEPYKRPTYDTGSESPADPNPPSDDCVKVRGRWVCPEPTPEPAPEPEPDYSCQVDLDCADLPPLDSANNFGDWICRENTCYWLRGL